MKTLVAYALAFQGTPYRWGGENPIRGFDCSGFAQEILRSVGIDPKDDQSAQMLHNILSVKGHVIDFVTRGAFIFFGKDVSHISHIAFAVDNHRMIEAGGGDSSTIDLESANRRNAFIRIRPITSRPDIVAVVMPDYPKWMELA